MLIWACLLTKQTKLELRTESKDDQWVPLITFNACLSSFTVFLSAMWIIAAIHDSRKNISSYIVTYGSSSVFFFLFLIPAIWILLVILIAFYVLRSKSWTSAMIVIIWYQILSLCFWSIYTCMLQKAACKHVDKLWCNYKIWSRLGGWPRLNQRNNI